MTKCHLFSRKISILLWLWFAFSQIAWADEHNAPLNYRIAGGTVPEWPKSSLPEDTPNMGIDWKYPVFQDNDKSKLKALNGWLRTESLKALFLGEAPKLKDSAILAKLKSDPAFYSNALSQAALTPTKNFGSYMFFTLNQEWQGSTRPQHGIRTLMFDYASGKPVTVKSLFKPDAKVEFQDLLEKTIEQSSAQSEKEYRACKRKHPSDYADVCTKPLNPDSISYCIGKRGFDWDGITIGNSREIFIEFGFDPSEWDSCGDGVYSLRGKSVSKQFLKPKSFETERTPVNLDEVQPVKQH